MTPPLREAGQAGAPQSSISLAPQAFLPRENLARPRRSGGGREWLSNRATFLGNLVECASLSVRRTPGVEPICITCGSRIDPRRGKCVSSPTSHAKFAHDPAAGRRRDALGGPLHGRASAGPSVTRRARSPGALRHDGSRTGARLDSARTRARAPDARAAALRRRARDGEGGGAARASAPGSPVAVAHGGGTISYRCAPSMPALRPTP